MPKGKEGAPAIAAQLAQLINRNPRVSVTRIDTPDQLSLMSSSIICCAAPLAPRAYYRIVSSNDPNASHVPVRYATITAIASLGAWRSLRKRRV